MIKVSRNDVCPCGSGKTILVEDLERNLYKPKRQKTKGIVQS